MDLTSEIVNDTLAARRFRLLAPLAVLLALVALALAPGIIGIDSSEDIWIDQLMALAACAPPQISSLTSFQQVLAERVHHSEQQDGQDHQADAGHRACGRPCVAATGGRGGVGAGGHQPAARQTKLLRPWPTRKASAAAPSPIARPPSPPGRRQRVVLGNLVTASSPTFFPIAVPTSVELR